MGLIPIPFYFNILSEPGVVVDWQRRPEPKCGFLGPLWLIGGGGLSPLNGAGNGLNSQAIHKLPRIQGFT